MKKQAARKSPREIAIEDLQKLREEIKPHIIRAGIQEQEFNAPVKGLEEFSDEAIEEMKTWLQEFRATAIQGVLAIWLLKSEEWWSNLVSLYGLHKTREQKLLRAAQKRLRASWRERNGKPVKEEATENA